MIPALAITCVPAVVTPGSTMRITALARPILAIALLLALGPSAIDGLRAETAPAGQAPLTVAAAADLGPALDDLVRNFEKRSGTRVAIVLGSSGNLTMQIEHGAPYDVFFSADTDYPRQLVNEGLALPSSLFVYAQGKLVLFVPRASPLDLQQLGMQALRDSRVHKIAIANPQHAPYGRAAVAAMKTVGVYSLVSQKLVLGENVSQAAQFVVSGNAQIGFVPLSLALAPGMAGRHWEVPPDLYPPLYQAVVVLKAARARTQAEAFLRFLRSPEAADILRRYGFSLPEAQ